MHSPSQLVGRQALEAEELCLWAGADQAVLAGRVAARRVDLAAKRADLASVPEVADRQLEVELESKEAEEATVCEEDRTCSPSSSPA